MRISTLALASAFAALAGSALPALAQDVVGVASCDSFLKTYSACITEKIPANQRSSVTTAIEQTQANWKAAAATPEGKAKLDTTCKETAEKLKKEVAALNCAW